MVRINNLQGSNTSLREKCASLRKSLDTAKAKAGEWQRKYEQVLSKHKAEEDQVGSKVAVLKSRCSASEAKLVAAKEQAQSAQEEAEDWKRKYDIAFREAKAAPEKAVSVQERSSKETQRREYALREEFTSHLADKEEEIKEKTAKIEYAEQCLTTLKMELKVNLSYIESLQREKRDLEVELEGIRASQRGAHHKISLLEARVEEREKEIESLLESNNEHRTSTVQVLQGLLDSERAAHADANNRAEALSHQLQSAQAKLDKLQQELTSIRLNETTLDSKLRTASHGKRSRMDDYDMDVDSVQDGELNERILRVNKRSRSTTS